MAFILVLLGLPFLLGAARNALPEVREHVPSLAAAWRRPEIRRGLAAAAIYVVAQKVSLGMLGPFLIDAGIDLATVGLLNGVGSMIFGFAAALAGGALVRVWGVRNVLMLALALQAAALSFFAAYHFAPGIPTPVLMAVAVVSSSGFMALGFVALYAQFMRWSDPRQAGVDFTMFQCMDAVISMAGGVAAGYAAQHLGYGVFFAGAGLLALAAVPGIAMLTSRENLPPGDDG
jgi:MFS transporter (putative signal transducer)